MKKIKVVEFFGEPLNYGGQEAFILNMYNNFSNNLELTFITPYEATNTNLKELISKKRDKLIFDDKAFETKLRKKYIIDTANKHLTNEYDVIHIHSGSLFNLYNVAKIARKKGIKKVIVHSHSAGKKTIKNIIIKFLSKDIGKYVDVFLGCTKEAGESKFPTKIINSNKFKVINNGINLNKFIFDKTIREEYRKKFDVENKLVLINIGRFSKEKNQIFLIELFNEYFKKNKNSHLFLIGGNGDELKNIEEKIKDYNLVKNITILKNRDDINYLLYMSDIFLLPSLWEGLPVTGIEAQTTGIPCIFSSNITETINVSEAFHKLSLDTGIAKWIKLIDELKKQPRYDTIADITKSGYDCKKSAEELEKIYMEEV